MKDILCRWDASRWMKTISLNSFQENVKRWISFLNIKELPQWTWKSHKEVHAKIYERNPESRTIDLALIHKQRSRGSNNAQIPVRRFYVDMEINYTIKWYPILKRLPNMTMSCLLNISVSFGLDRSLQIMKKELSWAVEDIDNRNQTYFFHEEKNALIGVIKI